MQISFIYILSLVAMTMFFLSCNTNAQKTTTLEAKNKENKEDKKVEKKSFLWEKTPKKDTSFQIKGHWVDIRVPNIEKSTQKNTQNNNIKGAVLVLPGWSFDRKDWCNKSSLCKRFLQENYILVLPEMNKSVYSSKFYPETYPEGKQSPNKQWVLEDFMPFLQQKFGIFEKEKPNFVLGLSTGGRGVALLCLALPDIWRAGAGLSGDYEQTLMPNDNLIKAFYGDFKKFAERWKNEDNPNQQAKDFKTPLYLGHGKQDKIVPTQQTQVFYENLKKYHPNLPLKLNLVDAQHDYKYWDSEVENMIHFFEKVK